MAHTQCICGGVIVDRGRTGGPSGRRRQELVRVADCLRCGQVYPLKPAHLSPVSARWVEKHNREALEAHQAKIRNPEAA